ncbi:MAG: hypothetical protein AAFY38_09040 [Pseudomonadota bacterium]
MDFSDEAQAEAWFAEQTPERRCVITSRAALRVLAAIGRFEFKRKERLAIAALRATLTSAGRGLGRPADVGGLERSAAFAARSASVAARSAASAVAVSADSAASAVAASADSAASAVAARSVAASADSAASAVAARSAAASVAAAFAARSAAFAARSAASAVAASADSAASAVAASADSAASAVAARSAAAAASAARSAIASDTEQNDDALMALPVWPEGNAPDWATEQHKIWLDYLGDHPDWAFWRRWYSQMWDGTFRDWDLAVHVALIPDEFWEGDDALSKVAREIEKISDRLRTSITVPIIRNNNDTAFRLKDEAPLPDEVLDFIKERVGGALDTALADGGANGFDAECPEAMAIRKALTSRNPSAVAGLLNDASLMFQKNLGNRYPDDGSLIALQAAAFSGAEEICETDELARKRCLRASKLFLRDNPPPLDRKDMEQFVDEVAAEAEGAAAEIIRQDGEAIASGRAVGRFIRARFANYASTIVQWIDRTKKGEGRVTWLWKQVKRVMDAFEDTPPDA